MGLTCKQEPYYHGGPEPASSRLSTCPHRCLRTIQNVTTNGGLLRTNSFDLSTVKLARSGSHPTVLAPRNHNLEGHKAACACWALRQVRGTADIVDRGKIRQSARLSQLCTIVQHALLTYILGHESPDTWRRTVQPFDGVDEPKTSNMPIDLLITWIVMFGVLAGLAMLSR